MMPATRPLGWIAWAILLVMMTPLLGPVVERVLLPVRIDQRVENVVRTDHSLCWHWVSLKLRNRVSDNIDSFLETYERASPHGPYVETDRAVVAPYREDTLQPWSRGTALPVTGHPDDQPWCVQLPGYVRPDTPLRLEQTAYYPGAVPLWHVALRLPVIVSPPEFQVPRD